MSDSSHELRSISSTLDQMQRSQSVGGLYETAWQVARAMLHAEEKIVFPAPTAGGTKSKATRAEILQTLYDAREVLMGNRPPTAR